MGDPNQAIFESLGGFAITAEDFAKQSGIDFKDAELTDNYRSSDRVIEYFNSYNLFGSTIDGASKHKTYPSLVTYDTTTSKSELEDQLVSLIRHNVETLNIPPSEVCILAPWWMHLAAMTRNGPSFRGYRRRQQRHSTSICDRFTGAKEPSPYRRDRPCRRTRPPLRPNQGPAQMRIRLQRADCLALSDFPISHYPSLRTLFGIYHSEV